MQGIRADADDPFPHFNMVARGKDKADFDANVEQNARLHAHRLDSVESLAELAYGTNVTETKTGGTPPCPWEAHLNSNGRVVGAGSFGEVVTASVKCDSSITVAIKKMAVGDKDAKEVQHEAELMDKFSSQNFMKIYGMGKSTTGTNVRYILMEAAKGGSFQKYVDRAGRSQEHRKLAEKLFIDALEGVVEMHRANYHHRDLKPANILVTEECSATQKCQGKVADLGESCEKAQCKDLHGTPLYMAPELWTSGTNSARNDVWSMGIILYQILNKGKLPSSFSVSTRQALGAAIKKLDVTKTFEYKNTIPSSPLKPLVALMLKNRIQDRIASDEALDYALRAVYGCGIFSKNGALCSEDGSRVVKLLPSCWPDPGVDEWIPQSPVRKPEDSVPEQEVKQHMKVPEVEQLTPVIQQVQQVVEQPPIIKRPLPEVIVEKDFEQEGVVAEVPLQDDTRGMTMSMRSSPQKEGIVKVFTIKSPKTNVGLSYIFQGNDGKDKWGNPVVHHVNKQGVVLDAWAKLKKAYTTGMGIPLAPGDEIQSVNDKSWDDLVDDQQFKDWAMAGALGKLTFLIIKAA